MDWFSFYGCTVSTEKRRSDSGYDFRVDGFKGKTAAVEVRKYKSSTQVSISVVRQMAGSVLIEKIPIGIIVSSAPFTRSAINFAKEIEPEIHLWTLEDMAEGNQIINP